MQEKPLNPLNFASDIVRCEIHHESLETLYRGNTAKDESMSSILDHLLGGFGERSESGSDRDAQAVMEVLRKRLAKTLSIDKESSHELGVE
jgi:hypothetical protein